MNARFTRGVSHIVTAAAVSVAILCAAIGAHLGSSTAPKQALATTQPVQAPTYVAIADSNENGVPDWKEELEKAGIVISQASSSAIEIQDPLSYLAENVTTSLISNYLTAKQEGIFTSETGNSIANSIVTNLMQAPSTRTPYTEADFTLVFDSSPARIEQYRHDMQIATKELLSSSEPEFALFGRYLETNDKYWLQELQKGIDTYVSAEKNMQKVDVPDAAIDYHIRATNAVAEYAHTLQRLIRFADDSIAVLALLRAYNEVEREMILAFDALAQFYARSASGQ